MAKPKIMLVSPITEFVSESRAALGDDFDVFLADNAEEGLLQLGRDPRFRVVVSGLNLPAMNGNDFLAAVRKDHPKVMRIMATAEEGVEIVAGAVNIAHVFALLPRPCPPDELRETTRDAVITSRKLQAEADSMRDTLFGTVKMLVDILELTHPAAVRRSKRIRRRAQEICSDLNAMPAQFMDMIVLLSNIGCVGLPAGLLRKMEKGKDITPQDMKMFRAHPSIAAHLLGNVPRMGKVAEIIRHQNTPCSKKPPLGARILKVCIDMDQMQLTGTGPAKGIEYMRGKPEVYDAEVLEALERHRGESEKVRCNQLMVADLEPGMVMQTDMVTEAGNILLNKGETLSEASHLRIQAFSGLLRIKEPVCAVMPE